MKKKFNRETKIGLVTLVGLFLLYFGLNYLKGVDVFKPTNHYFVRFQSISELQKSAPVYVDGFKVGLVNSVNYDYETNKGIIIEIALEKDMRIKTGTYVKITTGLTTGASLNLVLNRESATYYTPGDTLKGTNPAGLMDVVSAEIMPKVENLLPKLDSILNGLQLIVNHPALIKSFDYIETTTANLAHSSAQLNTVMSRDLPQIVSNLNAISSDFSEVSSQLKSIDYQATMRTVDDAVKNIDRMTERMNSKDNSMGLLLNDTQLYENLNSTAFNASELMLDLKKNPKRYVHFSIW